MQRLICSDGDDLFYVNVERVISLKYSILGEKIECIKWRFVYEIAYNNSKNKDR